MALDEELELDNSSDDEKKSRIRNLANKVKTVSEEATLAKAELEKAKAEAQSHKREAEFADQFSDTIGKYPNAKDFKKDIKDKVMAGYTVEDATVSVLAKAGKLSSEIVDNPVAGGSAPTARVNPNPEKTLAEMNQQELRAEVMKAIDEGRISADGTIRVNG